MEYIYLLYCGIGSFYIQECFGLNAETLLEKAVQLNHVGGTYGGCKNYNLIAVI